MHLEISLRRNWDEFSSGSADPGVFERSLRLAIPDIVDSDGPSSANQQKSTDHSILRGTR